MLHQARGDEAELVGTDLHLYLYLYVHFAFN